MLDYTAPIDDMMFSLEVIGYRDLAARPCYHHADLDTVRSLLEEYAKVTAQVVSPTNEIGDRHGATFDRDTRVVSVPAEVTAAYRQIVDGGWTAVPSEPEYGGGGFPATIGALLTEMLHSANLALGLCPMLTAGAVEALTYNGTPEQRDRYLPKLLTGEWSGTMGMTETEAGSDVGALRTRAVQAPDGTWRIFGQKIFITWGEHEMSDNIVHFVLARVDGAPSGTKGISCFVVPKYLPAADGSPGERNDVYAVSLEHKMGINVSPTCVMAFGDGGEGAVGELIGEVNAGMRTMFKMMNSARLVVGQQGLGTAERSYQLAHHYAMNRVQTRVSSGSGDTTIIGHADIRRMLYTIRAYTEAMRHLVLANARAIDDSRSSEDSEARRVGQELADLYTPMSKAWCTDLGNEMASLGVQIHGGMGFVEDTGAAQLYRDVRIAAIYEGTNGIQALDLVGRKLSMRGGAVVHEVLDAVASFGAALPSTMSAAFEPALAATRALTQWMLDAEPLDRQAGATPFLRVLSTMIGGGFMARQWELAHANNDEQRMSTAAFYITQLLPTVHGLAAQITAGAAPLYELSAEHLASR